MLECTGSNIRHPMAITTNPQSGKQMEFGHPSHGEDDRLSGPRTRQKVSQNNKIVKRASGFTFQ